MSSILKIISKHRTFPNLCGFTHRSIGIEVLINFFMLALLKVHLYHLLLILRYPRFEHSEVWRHFTIMDIDAISGSKMEEPNP